MPAESADIAPSETGGRIKTRLDRIEMQPRSLAGESHRSGEDGLLGRCIGVKADRLSEFRFDDKQIAVRSLQCEPPSFLVS